MGESDHLAFGPPASLSLHHSRGDRVVYIWVQLKRWCAAYVGAVEEMMCGCYRGGIVVMDVFWRRVCKYEYDLRKGGLFVLSWARVRHVRWGSLSSELLMCGGGVNSMLLLFLVARCLETIDVCI